ncbi:MAG: hypothetical protein ACO4CU_07405 [Ilumatobacteraceae bacterium]
MTAIVVIVVLLVVAVAGALTVPAMIRRQRAPQRQESVGRSDSSELRSALDQAIGSTASSGVASTTGGGASSRGRLRDVLDSLEAGRPVGDGASGEDATPARGRAIDSSLLDLGSGLQETLGRFLEAGATPPVEPDSEREGVADAVGVETTDDVADAEVADGSRGAADGADDGAAGDVDPVDVGSADDPAGKSTTAPETAAQETAGVVGVPEVGTSVVDAVDAGLAVPVDPVLSGGGVEAPVVDAVVDPVLSGGGVEAPVVDAVVDPVLSGGGAEAPVVDPVLSGGGVEAPVVDPEIPRLPGDAPALGGDGPDAAGPTLPDVSLQMPTAADRWRDRAIGRLDGEPIEETRRPLPGTASLRQALQWVLVGGFVVAFAGATVLLLVWQQARSSGLLSQQFESASDAFDLVRSIERWVAYVALGIGALWMASATYNIRRVTGARRNPWGSAASLLLAVLGVWLVGDEVIARSTGDGGRYAGFLLQVVFLVLPWLVLERVSVVVFARRSALRLAFAAAVGYLILVDVDSVLSTVEFPAEFPTTGSAPGWGSWGRGPCGPRAARGPNSSECSQWSSRPGRSSGRPPDE